MRLRGLSPWNDGDLDQGMGILEQPANGSMTRFMEGNYLFLMSRDDFISFFKSANNAVDGIEEILLLNG